MTYSSDPTKRENPQDLKFKYEKSEFFRTIHVDGVWGCVTPNMGIQIAFWNERFPLPNLVEYRVLEDGSIEEFSRDIPDTIIREVEVSLAFDVETAEMLIDWLSERVEEIYTFLEAGSANERNEMSEEEEVSEDTDRGREQL
jgi:hypothetical protein